MSASWVTLSGAFCASAGADTMNIPTSTTGINIFKQ